MTLALRNPGGSGCSIFVGNLPFDAQEDELKEIFSRAGQVRNVRVVLDRDTRAPKGYAFCDFDENSSVQVAIEKLNNVEYNGRKLRIDGAERELSSKGEKGGGEKGGGGGKGGPAAGDLPPIPTPMPTVIDKVAEMREKEAYEAAKAAAADAAERAEVARLMETLSPLQLLNIVGEMQRLAVSAPEVARALVQENVQLALALQHAEFLVGLLEDPTLPTEPEVKERAKSVREKLWPGGAPVISKVGGFPLGQTVMPGVATAFPTMQPGFGQTLAAPMPFMTAVAPMPMVDPRAAMQHPVPQAQPAQGQTEEQRRGLLERLVQLSPAQIDQLPLDQKVQLLNFLQTLPPTA